MREICFDTETTGFDPKEGDRIIEIGCVEIIDRKLTGKTFRELINPNRKNSKESIEITGITDDILKDKPKFSDVSQSFLDFISDSQLIAHNASFDINFVNYELNLIGVEPLKNKVIDSLTLAKVKFPGKKNNLNVLCERYNIDNTKREKHGALLDAELLAEVYLRLTESEQVQFFSENKSSSNEISLNNLLREIEKKEIIQSRNFKIEESEEELHKLFIGKNIEGSIW